MKLLVVLSILQAILFYFLQRTFWVIPPEHSIDITGFSPVVQQFLPVLESKPSYFSQVLFSELYLWCSFSYKLHFLVFSLVISSLYWQNCLCTTSHQDSWMLIVITTIFLFCFHIGHTWCSRSSRCYWKSGATRWCWSSCK